MSQYNQTNSRNFVLDIPDAGLTKAFKLNIQTALIPGVRIPVTETPSGTKGLGRAHIPGSTIEFDPLVLRFLVDENLDSWLELYQWMLSINNYLTSDNQAWQKGQVPEFITLHIMDNTNKNIVMSFHYYGAWCSDLGDIEFSYTEDSDPVIACSATFSYKYFVVERNGVLIDTKKSIAESAFSNISNDISNIGMNPRIK